MSLRTRVAKETVKHFAAQLAISTTAAEQAYCVAFNTLHLISTKSPSRSETATRAMIASSV